MKSFTVSTAHDVWIMLQDKAAALPPEPAAGAPEPLTTALFRFPDGGRVTRRFLQSQPVQHLFDFIDAQPGGRSEPGQYQLAMQFPARLLGLRDAGKSLAEAQVGTGQEVLMVQACPTR